MTHQSATFVCNFSYGEQVVCKMCINN